jgi:hypothetical protein
VDSCQGVPMSIAPRPWGLSTQAAFALPPTGLVVSPVAAAGAKATVVATLAVSALAPVTVTPLVGPVAGTCMLGPTVQQAPLAEQANQGEGKRGGGGGRGRHVKHDSKSGSVARAKSE